jgi:hypothetical protein
LKAAFLSLCLYDTPGGTPTFRLDATAPADGICAGKPCWKETRTGFKYKSKDLMPDGLQKITLKEGDTGKAKIAVKGKGLNLGLPSLPLSPPVRVQLKRSDGSACWDATFSNPVANDTGRFKAKSD